MTKRNTVSEPAQAGTVRRPKRASATHSRKSSATADASAEAVSPDQDTIARLAHSFWEARGCMGGSPEEDWLRAERELLSR